MGWGSDQIGQIVDCKILHDELQGEAVMARDELRSVFLKLGWLLATLH